MTAEDYDNLVLGLNDLVKTATEYFHQVGRGEISAADAATALAVAVRMLDP